MKDYRNRARKNDKKSKLSDEMSDYTEHTQDPSWYDYPDQYYHPAEWNNPYPQPYQGFHNQYPSYHGGDYPYDHQ